MMTSAEMVKAALAAAKKTQVDLAQFMGCSKQNLNSRLARDSLSFTEVVKALGFCGHSIKLVNEDGAELTEAGNTGSPRVTQMVDGVYYDTEKATSLCSSRSDGDELFTELFRKATGEYFIVYYQLWEGGHNNITPVDENAAGKFWERFSGKPIGDMK